jgi:hypothetical protein
MSATGTVAIIGAIATPTVAAMGFTYNGWRSKIEHRAARQLALDSQQHGLDVRRRDRAYDARRDAYRLALQWALNLLQQVQLTDPVVTIAGQPGPPGSLSTEHFNEMRIEVSAVGSKDVDASLERFRNAVRSFFLRVRPRT